MATAADTNRLDTGIQSRLAKLRWLIRGYIACRGFAAILATAVLVFWISLLLDWVFEPPRAARMILLMTGGLIVFVAALRRLIVPLLVPLTDASMALLLERRFESLGDRLVTSVELAEHRESLGRFSAAMLDNTSDEARRLTDDVSLTQVLRRQPLIISACLAVALLFSLASFAFWQTEATKIWLDRSVMLGEATWPRATKIYVDGFEEGEDGRRVVKIARGTDIDIIARADLRDDWTPPDLLEIHYENAGGSSDRPPMSKRGKSIPGRDEFQEFRYEFKDVQTTTRFSVVAVRRGAMSKDDRIDNLVIEAVEPPDINQIALRCEFPEYVGKKNGEFPVTGIMSMPEGTDVVVVAKSSKPLRSADWRVAGEEADAEHSPITISPDDPTELTLPLGKVTDNTTVLFTLVDSDGVSNQQPIRLRLLANLDQIPRVDVRPTGVGAAVTPKASIPFEGSVADDYGLTRTWFNVEAEGVDEQQIPFPLPEDGEFGQESSSRLDVSQLQVVLGAKFTLTIRAADNYPLAEEPHIGKSERFEFEVITEDELRAKLESKEVFLRQRLSSVADELVRVSDTLLRTRKRLTGTKSSGDEDDQENDDATTSQSLPLNILALEESLQSKDRTQNELVDLAAEFDSILLELVYNNVSYLEKTTERLKDGISDKLKGVVRDEYPAWGQQLRTARELLKTEKDVVEEIDVARAQLATILEQIEEVLLKMEDFGTFQESLAKLRQIIADHREISRMTKQRREELKKELRKGLLD